MIIGYVSTL